MSMIEEISAGEKQSQMSPPRVLRGDEKFNHFILYILPLILIGGLFAYLAPMMRPRLFIPIPYERTNRLAEVARFIIPGTYYFLAAISGGKFIYHSFRLVKSGFAVEPKVVLIMSFFLAVIWLMTSVLAPVATPPIVPTAPSPIHFNY